MESPTPVEMLMAEISANIEALITYELENISKPPRGSISETGHYRALNEAKLKRKEWEALHHILENLAHNVASTIFATLDGEVESDFENFPKLALVERGGSTPISESLRAAFAEMWEEEIEQSHPHPD
jgi:hypothetical protein